MKMCPWYITHYFIAFAISFKMFNDAYAVINQQPVRSLNAIGHTEALAYFSHFDILYR